MNPAPDVPSIFYGSIIPFTGLHPPQITTSGPNELVLLYVWQLGDESTGGTSPLPPHVTAVSDLSGLSWTRRGNVVTYAQPGDGCGGGRCSISQELWWAFSKARQTNDTITVTLAPPPPASGPQDFQTGAVFGVKNIINPGNPFDANPSLQAVNSANLDGLNYNISFSTNLTTDLLLVSCGSIALTSPVCNELANDHTWTQTLESDKENLGGVVFNSVYTKIGGGPGLNITAGTFNWYASADAILGCGGPKPQLYPFVWVNE